MKILIAVSGGVDSMFLLENAARFFPGSVVAAAHCNFHLRGEESDGDERFVRRVCGEKGMPLYVKDFDTAAYASEHGVSIEMAARDLRYSWFAQICADYGFDAVAVAHNADDDAETMMLNLLRGTGTRGLCGMAPSSEINSVRLLRPMLGIPRSEIEKWMRENGRQWREDSSNAGTDYKRNKLRHKVFPVFKEINPSYLSALSKAREHIAQVDSIAQDYCQSAKEKIVDKDGRIICSELLKFKHWRYLLFRLTESCGIDESTLESLAKAISDGNPETRRFGGMTLSRGILSKEEESAAGEVRCEIIPFTPEINLKAGDGVLYLDAALFEGQKPVVRPCRPGDWMIPFGMKGRKKLSDLFTDLKFSPADKARAMVVEYPGQEGRVAALAGVRMDDSLRVTEKTTKLLVVRI